MKKILSVVLTVCLLISLSCGAFASFKDDAKLQFGADGKFKIMVLADVQDKYPLHAEEITFIKEALATAQPDLVVFCGDNIVTSDVRAYEELLTPLVNAGVPFTFVFGNHDDECSDLNKEEMLAEYQKYAGCLAYDADAALHGCATHNLPILSSDGSKVSFNLWLMDSGDYVFDANGEQLGYDCVRADQIAWYEQTSEALQAENGGEKVPSLMFQHIIPQEPVEKIFYGAYIPLGDATFNFEDGTTVTYIPNVNNFSGYIYEKSCPSLQNDGQWDSLVARGDVLGMVVGHDHVNSFVADVDGVDLIQTAGSTYESYYNDMLQGCRILELDEASLWEYETYNLTTAELSQAEGSALGNTEDRTQANYSFSLVLSKFMEKLMELVRYIMKDLAFIH